MPHEKPSPPRALTGLRILEAGTTLGSYGGKLLADLGADVIKIEPPSGCPDRAMPPFWGDEPAIERSLWYLALNTGKRSVTLDLSQPAGRSAFEALAARSHAVVDSYAPGHLDAMGLGYERLRRTAPHLVYTSITGFGLDGPYAMYKAPDIVGMAMSGLMQTCGYKNEAPSGGFIAYLAWQAAGLRAAEGTLAALWDQQATGLGQRVEVSMQEVLTFGLDAQIYSAAYPTATPPWMQRAWDLRGVMQPYECKDGWVLLVWLYHVEKIVEMLAEEGMEGGLRDPNWLDPAYAVANQPYAEGLLRAFTSRYTREEVVRRAQQWSIPAGSFYDMADVYAEAQFAARGFFVPVEHPETGRTIAYPSAPYVMEATPVRIERAPRLGEHNEEILGEPNPYPFPGREGAEGRADLKSAPTVQTKRDSEAIPFLFPERERGKTTRRPLAGMRIVDLSWYGAGPSITRDMTTYGAEVIKVESVAHLDGMRAVQPSAPGRADSVNLGGWYNNANCGKMSAVLNLQHLGAKDVLLSLVRVADAVVENFTYPTLERLGYGVDVLRSVNPSLVVLRLPPMGTTGPRATLSGFGFSMLALAGVSNLVGPPERPPTGFGVTFGDSVSTPGHGAVSLFAALLHRRRTGQGQVIDMSQVEAATAMLGGALLDYAVNGRVQQRTGNRSPWACPHNAYRCKGDDRWCVIAVFTDEEWGALAAMLGQRAWLTDARFASVEARKQHEDDLDALIEAWTSQRTPDEVMETLQRAGVPSGALRSPNDVLHGDAHLKARGYYRWLPHPETPAMLVNGPLYRLSAADPNAIRRAPLIGEHNEAVYQELLGMAEAKADQLAVDGVIQ